MSFTSPKTYCDLSVTEVVAIEDDGAAAGPLKFSKEISVFAEKYEIV